MASANRDEYDFDVCLSYASEQREYVAGVAAELEARGIRVFYDIYKRASLWGKDLYSHLDHVYRESAKYCVIFVSRDYANKVWAKHELRSAQARALAENEDYILPVRCDDTDLPGLPPQFGYIELVDVTPGELAGLIADKLIIMDATPSASLPEFSDSVRQRYGGYLAQAGLEVPERWDEVTLGNLRRACPAGDATGDLLDALRMAAGALSLLARFDGQVIGVRKLQYLYQRHVGGWPIAVTAEEMLIEAASASIAERRRSLTGPGYEPEPLTALARFMLGIAASLKALDGDPHDPSLRELMEWLTGNG